MAPSAKASDSAPLAPGVYYLPNPDQEGRLWPYAVDADRNLIPPSPVDPAHFEERVKELRAQLGEGG